MTSQKVTELLECSEINVKCPYNGCFGYTRKGYVRLVQDMTKCSYVLELFNDNSNSSINQIAALSINISKADLQKLVPRSMGAIITFSDTTLIHLKFVSQDVANLFLQKLDACLEDPDLLDMDLLLVEKQPGQSKPLKENPTLGFFQISNKEGLEKKLMVNLGEPVQISKQTNQRLNNQELLGMLLNDTSKKEPVIAAKSNSTVVNSSPANNIDSITQNISSPAFIPKSKFYSTQQNPQTPSSPSVLVNKSSVSLKDHSNTPKNFKEFENTPPNVTKRRKLDIQESNENKLINNNNENNEVPPTNLNKRNANGQLTSNSKSNKQNFNNENQENDENNGSIKWNRNNSMSKSCGKGFSNLGNTCYMNAILQCLLNIDVFSNDLISNYKYISQQDQSQIIKHQQLQQQACLYNCMCELLKAREAHNDALQVQSLKEIKNTISQEATRFSGYQQHDAHEFLCQVLDQLKDDVDKFNKKNSLNNNNNNNKFNISNATEEIAAPQIKLETTTTTSSISIKNDNENGKKEELQEENEINNDDANDAVAEKNKKNAENDTSNLNCIIMKNQNQLLVNLASNKQEQAELNKINSENDVDCDDEGKNINKEKLLFEATSSNSSDTNLIGSSSELDEIITKNKNNTSYSNEKCFKSTEQQQQQQQSNDSSKDSSSNKFRILNNPVVDNFEFEVTHAIQCKKCNNTITKIEEYNNLCLELPNIQFINKKLREQQSASNLEQNLSGASTQANPNVLSQIANLSIQDALDVFFKEEVLDDFKCESCQNVQEVIIRRRFTKLPRILILHLKRYQFQEVVSVASTSSSTNELESIAEGMTDEPQQNTISRNFRMFKNDSVIKIPPYLTLKWLTAEQSTLKLPKQIPIELSKTFKQSLIENSSSNSDVPSLANAALVSNSPVPKKAPLKQQQSNTNNSVTNTITKSESSAPSATTRPGRPRVALKPLGANNNRTLWNKVISEDNRNQNVIDLEAESLPDICLDTPPNNSKTFDPKNFYLKEMSEEDQINAALELSRKEYDNSQEFRSIISACTSVSSNSCNQDNQGSSLMNLNFLDGQMDVDFENFNSKTNSRKGSKSRFLSNDENEMDKNQEYRPPGKLNLTNNLTNERPKRVTRSCTVQNRTKTKQQNDIIETLDDDLEDEQEQLDKAIQQSLISHKMESQYFMDDLEFMDPFITENSKQNEIEVIENNKSLADLNYRALEQFLNRTESEKKLIEQNAINGTEQNSYRIIGIVNHLGSSSNSGHYISDVYNLKTKTWSSFDDTKVRVLTEEQVLQKRAKTGYIFFYIHNSAESAS